MLQYRLGLVSNAVGVSSFECLDPLHKANALMDLLGWFVLPSPLFWLVLVHIKVPLILKMLAALQAHT